MAKKITEIIIETEQIIVCRSPACLSETWCEDCAAFVRMLTPEEATRLIHIPARTIYRQAEAGELHFTETPEGLLLICLNSLTNKRHQSKLQCRDRP